MKHVIIIGGGIAGLAAAVELRDCRVTLLEAKSRFGGRIRTIRTSAGVVELGAEFLHGESQPLMDLIRTAGLSTRPVSGRNQVFERGRFHPIDVWETFGELANRIEPQQPDRAFHSFLHQQPLDERTRRMMLAFAEGFNAADAKRLSIHALRRAEYSADQRNGGRQARIENGYGAVVDFLLARARERGANLETDSAVQRVRWAQGRVEVKVARADGIQNLSGDAAIVTLPLGVLKARTVVFDPPLTDKAEAIDGLAFGHVAKIALVFRKAWWPERNFGFIHALDEPIVTWWSHEANAMLTGWTGGPKAEALLALDDLQFEALAIETLARLFNVSPQKIREELISTHTRNWRNDPNVRGAYTYVPVGGLFLPKLLGAPLEDTLFFAGEATARDAQMGTTFAALESGLRAAREVQKS